MKYEIRKVGGLPFYFYLQWHITNKCNLKCKHCYNVDALTDLTLPELQRTLDEFLSAIHLWQLGGDIAITGGEPFVRNDVFDLLYYMNGKRQDGFPIAASIMSNGTTLTREVIREIQKYRGMVSEIQISLDGAKPETHDLIRGNGVFAKAVNATQHLRASSIPVSLHFVLNRTNMGEVVDFIRLAVELGARRITISRLVPIGAMQKDQMLSKDELKTCLTEAYSYYNSIKDTTPGTFLAVTRCDLWHLVDIEAAVKQCDTGHNNVPDRRTLGRRCACGFNGLTLDANGEVYACRRLPISIGNILDDAFDKIWYGNELLWRFRKRSKYQRGKCQQCKFMTDPRYSLLCSGGAPCISFASTGDCFNPDPQCWYDPEKSR